MNYLDEINKITKRNAEIDNAVEKLIAEKNKNNSRMQALGQANSLQLQNDLSLPGYKPVKYIKGSKGKKYLVPDKYILGLTWNERVLCVLKLIGQGFVEDIAKYVVSNEPSIELDFAIKRITLIASRYKRDKVIDTIKIGAKNRLIYVKNKEAETS